MVCDMFAEKLHQLSIASGVSNAECGVQDVAVKAVKQDACWPTVSRWLKTHGARSVHAGMGLIDFVAQ